MNRISDYIIQHISFKILQSIFFGTFFRTETHRKSRAVVLSDQHKMNILLRKFNYLKRERFVILKRKPVKVKDLIIVHSTLVQNSNQNKVEIIKPETNQIKTETDTILPRVSVIFILHSDHLIMLKLAAS